MNRENQRRILAMRRLYRRYRGRIGAVATVGPVAGNRTGLLASLSLSRSSSWF